MRLKKAVIHAYAALRNSARCMGTSQLAFPGRKVVIK